MLNVEERDTIHARVLEHNKSLTQSLERPVGVVVALHDLFANIDRQISRPKIIELDIYSCKMMFTLSVSLTDGRAIG